MNTLNITKYSEIKAVALIVLAFCWATVSAATYTIPEPDIEIIAPRGFQVSIPDVNGMQFFSFNGNLNRPIRVDQTGAINGDIYVAETGRWIFKERHTAIQPADVINYWLYVQLNNTSYTKTGAWSQRSNVRPTIGSCTSSVTTTARDDVICQGQLILEDNFDSLNSTIWSREILIPSQPHYEFCVYHNHPESVDIRNGILRFIPSILEDSYGEGSSATGSMILAGCTSHVAFDCNRTAAAYNILPPVISARLTSLNQFNFRYGRIEIRAKFPEGDWLYPELWLQPKNPAYNSEYGNVRIRLGMARGNNVLMGASRNFGGQLLEFGLQADLTRNFRDAKVEKLRTTGDTWTNDFHVYSTTWNPDGFIFHVDGEEVGRLDPGNNGWFGDGDGNNLSSARNKMAPFDGQFYITLGIGVGGVRNFPENTRSGEGPGYEKPWKNVAAKAMLRFWQAKDQWLPNWRTPNADKSQLQVDYVRVWAL